MNNKLERTNEDVRYVLSQLLPRVKDPRVQQGGLISITRAEVTGDLRWCKVYVSVLGELNEKEFKRGLKSAAPWLRRELGGVLLKAVLTPHNRAWTCGMLYTALTAEAAQLR